MSLRPLGTLIPGPAQGDPSLPQGGHGLLPHPVQEDLSMSLKTLGALLPGPAQGDPSLPQGGQGLLPYPIQGGLILVLFNLVLLRGN